MVFRWEVHFSRCWRVLYLYNFKNIKWRYRYVNDIICAKLNMLEASATQKAIKNNLSVMNEQLVLTIV